MYYADEVVKWADAARDDYTPLESEAEYIDPVSMPNGSVPGIDHFSGKWLASVHRVRVGPEQFDTGWVVLVQERRDEILQPVRDLQWRLGYVGLVACAAVLVLVALMWAGMALVMDTSSRSPVTRYLRRWAGLHTSATSGSIGTAGNSSLQGGMTARVNATPTPGNQPP